jgi:hypothetical protein
MNWLKRNLFLAVGGAVALLLLGLAGFYLYTQHQKEATVSTQLETQINEWRSLTTRTPSVTEENIVAARKEQEKLSAVLATTRRHFVPASTVTNMDSSTFKSLLENTIFDLEQQARNQGVAIPPRYSFTADWLRRAVVFDQAELLPLTHQLLELRALCQILFEARVHSLVRLRRVPVSTKDQGTADYLVGMSAITNNVTRAVVMPYEVVFQGFSLELSRVLEGLQRSPHCFMIRLLDVEESGTTSVITEPSTFTPGTPYPSAAPVPQRSPEQIMQERYGTRPGAGRYGTSPGAGRYGTQPGGRYATPPGVQRPGMVTPSVATRRGPTTELDEELLKFTLVVEAVRLPPSTE